MKKYVAFLLLVAIMLLAACGNKEEEPEQQKDIATEEKPQEDYRIVAGTVVVADIMDQLELEAIAVPGTVKKLPTRFEGLPSIGNAMQPDMEIIKSLNPTEVLSVSTLEYDLAPIFEQLNVPVDFVDLTSIDTMLSEIEELGNRYNRIEQAKVLIDKLKNEMAQVENIANEHEQPSVLILLGVPGSYLVATEHSYAGDLVKRAGAVNVMVGQEAEYLASNTEHLYNSNPDIILRMAHGMPDEVIKMFDEEFKTNDVWKHFNAVKNNRVYDLDEELFGTTAALNMSEALQHLIEIFYEQ
ncbi:heme ABC transporter substrate-binding protein IsdE [Metasolibacillus meyeri]|uniref:High-affinity heme uptake system protein IsdE n=1 Tax=Metasolibacillus meyeri TaxID=1071052 RepID=A0AAW9NS32_9BACL|nr:heme ABC transporter substrate-binding protein IsdE [Metasolibacillus meyeri]MEC1178783.1 heme ABC transporter substrate-binding protein IsdE [Metasolibacillus meyeri]